MSKKAALAMMMGMAASMLPREQPTQIKSYKIEQKEEEIQLSKQKLQKMKGKGARKNRGKNRKQR